jgi:hypothetical protein
VAAQVVNLPDIDTSVDQVIGMLTCKKRKRIRKIRIGKINSGNTEQ